MSLLRNLGKIKHKVEMDYFLERRVKKTFYRKLGYRLNLDNPRTFSEKMQWLKFHYRNPLLTSCADKIAVRKYVKETIRGGEKYFIPIYHIYNHIEDIEASELPESFVLKPNNSSGEVIMCSDKSKLAWGEVKNKLADWLHSNYFYVNGEWQYKNIIPQIICEKLLEGDIVDYGFFCFDGKPFICNAVYKDDRETGKGYTECFYNLDFQQLDLRQDAQIKKVAKPLNWDKMIEIARKLSYGFPFVRVDLRECEGHIYFGELTFTPADGMEPFHPDDWDLKLGNQINLDKIPSEFLKT